MMAKDIYRFIQTAVGQQVTGSSFYPTTLDIQQSLKSGWLRKQGGVVKSWQRRWFTIKGDCMYYYNTSDESKSPLGVIFLPGSHIIEHPFNVAEAEKFLFEIAPVSPDRQRMAPTHETYPLAAESDEERKEWVKAIKQVLYASVGGAIFGRPLEETLRFEKVKDQKRKVPEIIQLCAEYILKRGIDEEGIFRLPGRSSLIKQMCDAFDRGERPEIDVPEMDVHTAASLLKGYLRDLPGPLIPAEFYESVMRIVMREMPVGDDKAFIRLRELIRSIPVANYNVLQYICQFLGKVSAHSNKNKMTSINLATIFVQSFIRPEDDDPVLLMATASCRTMATLVFIERYEKIFNVEYTSEGATVVVDDLLGLTGIEEEPSCESKVGRVAPMPLNPDLFGLEINDSVPQPALRRNNARLSQQTSNGASTQSVHNSNRRGVMYVQNSRSSNESNDSENEASSGLEKQSEDKMKPKEGVQPASATVTELTNENVKQPVAPPRGGNQKSKEDVKQTVITSKPPLIGTDNAAVETLINLDIKRFSESDLRAHIDRLCQELIVRQNIIEGLNANAQLTEQKHEKQIDALLHKMSEHRAKAERYSRQLHLYQEKFGSL